MAVSSWRDLLDWIVLHPKPLECYSLAPRIRSFIRNYISSSSPKASSSSPSSLIMINGSSPSPTTLIYNICHSIKGWKTSRSPDDVTSFFSSFHLACFFTLNTLEIFYEISRPKIIPRLLGCLCLTRWEDFFYTFRFSYCRKNAAEFNVLQDDGWWRGRTD